jgi:hypothetical protein
LRERFKLAMLFVSHDLVAGFAPRGGDVRWQPGGNGRRARGLPASNAPVHPRAPALRAHAAQRPRTAVANHRGQCTGGQCAFAGLQLRASLWRPRCPLCGSRPRACSTVPGRFGQTKLRCDCC